MRAKLAPIIQTIREASVRGYRFACTHITLYVRFVGDFIKKGDIRKTKQFEILHRILKRGMIDPTHVHKGKIELTMILSGRIKFRVNKKELILNKGDYLFANPGTTIRSECVRTSRILTIHSPSTPSDKFLIEHEI